MPIANRDIVELLLARHELQGAVRADEELPTFVNVEHHAWLLNDLSIDLELLRDIDPSSPAAPRLALSGRLEEPLTDGGRAMLHGER